MKNKRIRSVVYLLFISCLLLLNGRLSARDIRSAQDLKNALGYNAIILGDTVRLSGDVIIKELLNIVDGQIILDLNKQTLLIDYKETKATANGIDVKGDGVNFLIKNGSFKINAANGEDKGWNTKGGNGYNASCVILNRGIVSIIDVIMIATPGKGGAGQNFWGSSNPGDPGSAWVVDSEGENTLGGMIPNGAYFSIPSNVDYKTKGAGINQSNATVSLITHNVTYNTNGGNPQPNAASYTIETSGFTLPSKPSKNGYEFVNWQYNNETIDPATLPITTERTSPVNVVFDAKWNVNHYDLAFETNGGSLSDDVPSTYTVETETFELPIPIKEKSFFKGWYLSSSFSGEVQSIIAQGSTGNKTFYAKWIQSYNIDYTLNGGTLPDNAVKSFTEESEDISLPTPERLGYTFEGWYANAEFTGDRITVLPTNSKGDKRFFARWKIINYPLTMVLNGGSVLGTLPESYTVEEQVVLMIPKRDHYTFRGWFVSELVNGTAIKEIPKGSIGEKTFYAGWRANTYTITFESNGGTSQGNVSYTVETPTFDLPVKTQKTGYTHTGWFCDEALTQPFGAVVETGSSGDLTLYAGWKLRDYRITYDCYHGANPVDAPVSYTFQDEVVLPVPVRAGFTFAGWHQSDMLDDAIQSMIPSGSTGDRHYYANWSAGNTVQIVRPTNGTLRVMQGETEIKSGDRVGIGSSLSVSAIPANEHSRFEKLIVNGKEYTSSPQTIVMPADGGLSIAAIFVDPRPILSAPLIVTDPLNTAYIPSGSSVWVTLQDTAKADTVMYRVDGSTPKRYLGPFQVSTQTATSKTMRIEAISRKEGMQDGIATREITFRAGKITISFDLPKGVTAHNPEGGEVVSAVATGGEFEFTLKIDSNYYPVLQGMYTTANGTLILPDIYGLYKLPAQTSDVVIKVVGLAGVSHEVSIKQSANGQVYFTDDASVSSRILQHGEYVSLTADAYEGYKFSSWTDGSLQNPRTLLVESDTVIEARFIRADPGYLVILPEIEGVEVRPLTGYNTTVKAGGTFKCYLRAKAGYQIGQAVVYANGELLMPTSEVYSIYNVQSNIVIAVDKVEPIRIPVQLPDNTSAVVVQTGNVLGPDLLLASDLICLTAHAPEGKRFSKWNDGRTENPRLVTAEAAAQQLPLFLNASNEKVHALTLPALAGVGLTPVDADASAVVAGSSLQLKLILLPAYSQSDVVVRANGKVLTQSLTLRASTAMQTFFYALENVDEDLHITVEGIELNRYVISLEQSGGGTLTASQTGLLSHGTEIELAAFPERTYQFAQWNNGQTLNPFTYKVAGDATLTGRFILKDVPLTNESIDISRHQVRVVKDRLFVETSEPTSLRIYDLSGRLCRQSSLGMGSFNYTLPAGQYIVRLGTEDGVKIVIR